MTFIQLVDRIEVEHLRYLLSASAVGNFIPIISHNIPQGRMAGADVPVIFGLHSLHVRPDFPCAPLFEGGVAL
jgi:hypothetical protein